MTVAQLVRRFRQTVAYDLDPVFGPYPEGGPPEEVAAWTEDAVAFLNEAALELSSVVYPTADRVTLTLTAGVGTYPLASSAFSARLVQPFAVEIDGARLRNAHGTAYGLWGPDELARRFPTWASDAPGRVARAAFRGDRLILHPAPDADGTAFVEGKVGAARLSAAAPTAVSDLPERLHPGLVGLAAYRACRDNAQEGGQFSRLAAMRDEAMATALELGRESLNAQIAGSGRRDGDRRNEEIRI